MGYLTWIILGALSGWIASMIMGKNSQMGAISNIIVGIIGAFIGGVVFRLIGASGVTGLNLWSVIVSVVGACILLFIANKIKR
ncbi:GlsB/YeaQ/YmgE family stress response membrane protein [Tissierella sp.]|uniref:GlsB/YeaQ/YmgE family stress response membrane protein n=1 Tax=Tissierella sp. TaxID=41274 RepID=UPI003029A63F